VVESKTEAKTHASPIPAAKRSRKRTWIHGVSVRVLGQLPPDLREAAEASAVREQALGVLQPPHHRACTTLAPP
jgi:hypothetical protein